MTTQVEKILSNGIVVTVDESYRIIPQGAVAIDGDSIVAVGPSHEIEQQYTAKEVIDCSGSAIIPGLINAHTHVPMTLLRGLADDLRLDVWLTGYMMPTEQKFVTPEFVTLGTLLACAEMIRSGITTFCDMYYFEDEIAEAVAGVGMRAVCGQTVLKFPSPDAENYEQALDLARRFVEKWKGHPLIIPAVSPHAPYTTTAEILQSCAKLAHEHDVPLHIHLSETALEVTESRREHGMPVIPWVKKQGLFDAKVIAAHCVHLDTGEIHTLEHHRAGVAHNPTSNLKLASGIAPVTEMLEIGVKVGIGTDGPASNNDLDMFEETRLAALLAKTAADDPTALPARQAFTMATRMGAEALHIGDITGSLEVGKRADIAVIEIDTLHNWPHFNHDDEAIYSRLVYASKSTDVCHVLVNGEWLMKDRELQTIDVPPLLRDAGALAEKIDVFLRAHKSDVLSKLLSLGELQREESFEVQVKAAVADDSYLERVAALEDVTVVQTSHYRQYDTYFTFGSDNPNRLRYREDDFIGKDGEVTGVRTRLTLTDEGSEREFPNTILLSRSRYYSAATRPLRFYREYFTPEVVVNVVKERRRLHIDYHGMRIYVNLDKLIEPDIDGYYLEIKSRTWSVTDAESKSKAIGELLKQLGISSSALIRDEYVTIASSQ